MVGGTETNAGFICVPMLIPAMNTPEPAWATVTNSMVDSVRYAGDQLIVVSIYSLLSDLSLLQITLFNCTQQQMSMPYHLTLTLIWMRSDRLRGMVANSSSFFCFRAADFWRDCV